MTIEVQRLNNAYHMEARNEAGATLQMDNNLAHGGSNLALTPMQLLLAGIGGCSTIDIIDILKKQRQELQDIKVTINGEREANKEPSLFQTIHLHYKLYGNIEDSKAQQALKLSLDKYCSVAKTLEATAKITYTYEIISE